MHVMRMLRHRWPASRPPNSALVALTPVSDNVWTTTALSRPLSCACSHQSPSGYARSSRQPLIEQSYLRNVCVHSSSSSISSEQVRHLQTETTLQDGVLLLGFTQEDLHVLNHNLPTLFPGLLPSQVRIVTAPHISSTVTDLLSQSDIPHIDAFEQPEQEPQDPSSHQSVAGPPTPEFGRILYLVGASGPRYGHTINDALVQVGLAPAVVGAMQAKHMHQPMGHVRDALRASHADYWGLVRPVTLVAPLDELINSDPQPQQQEQQEAPGQQQQQPTTEHVLAPLADTRLVLSAILDAGEVPSSTGGWRRDEAHMVVLDGLITEEERNQLLDWLTTPGHDHTGPPPNDKWEQACVDREGDQASWGLTQDMLHALEESPPPPIIALQTRLAALYPEYTLAHMPADVLYTADEESSSLSSFVGNAVMQGDPCAWHDDADPATLPPSSPWVHCYGYYYNREPGRPRFVSLLLYLNNEWPDELHAETMFLDPSAQSGLFVRPSPGRVVLMDQDMTHRISAPSSAAGNAPRYSLVWKMVWFPKGDPTVSQERAHTIQFIDAVQEPGLCRSEWGEPIRLGSAGQLLGKRVWGSAS